ncbi:NAD(+)/NADH kinase [Baekduia soli]|uniref:NAD kinase n=1 Tax=Baekduia soli TaxID=496014 RepID=A0A5B8U4U7_9ACTN|nr:NAD(+)/NADH kinase [Baekduia soli]QEC47878.1 NAD(+)/NADH kinase [Baekduia soli]
MSTRITLDRIGLVVHPNRPLDRAIDTLRAWAQARGAAVVQVPIDGQDRVVAEHGDAGSCDLLVALGGDGTTLAALHAAAAAGRPVLGVACGSLGALTATSAADLGIALQALGAGDWTPRRLPGIAVTPGDGGPFVALNDLVVVRRGASQATVGIQVDDELYVRFAGDGIIVATPLGSSAYTLAAGGPVLAPGARNLVLTPLAPHGGCCPPIVVAPEHDVTITVEPGWGGARLESDGQIRDAAPATLRIAWRDDQATLVDFAGTEGTLGGLRRRGILADSPRVTARDGRDGALGPC